MTDVIIKKRRVFHIAKELNISHEEIIDLLKKHSIKVNSHMSPVDEDTYQLILEEFEKDLLSVDRYRKEQVRKQIHSRRLDRLTEKKPLKILMPDEQRRLESREQILAEETAKNKKLAIEAKQQKEEVIKLKKVVEKPDSIRTIFTNGKKSLEKEIVKLIKPKKLRLRKIDISEIESKIGSVPRKHVKKTGEEVSKENAAEKISIDSTIRKTLAKIDTRTKRRKYRRDKVIEEEVVETELKIVKVRDFMNVQELAQVLDINPTDIITKCLELGIPATINQRLTLDILALIAEDVGYRIEVLEGDGEDIFSFEDSDDDLKNAVPRSPVVTIMGHVDHGKTSLLDYIRNSNVVAGEAGGITQHIGAYEVTLDNGRSVTFLDTPGHEAFTAMRARGAQVTDVVILIVSADDGVQPQTIEAINHAKSANVPLVIAINKIDKPEANPDRVRRELSKHDIIVEGMGGKVQSMEVSAKTGDGIEDLLELLALETEILELKANPKTRAKATVIESRLDKGLGPIATILVQKGTLRIGDSFVCGQSHGKVKALFNERNVRIKSAGPSDPVQVLGFERIPQAGDRFAVVQDEKNARKLAEGLDRTHREIQRQMIYSRSLDTISREIKEGAIKSLPLIIKADVDGSIEALIDALSKIPSKEVKVDVVHKGVGIITESDILLASASGAIVIGFNVSKNTNANLVAKQEGVEVRLYNVIYDAVNEIRLALEGLLEPEIVEETLGRAEILQVFKISRRGSIAGCRVVNGKITRNDRARVIRDDSVVFQGAITSLKHLQNDVKEMPEGKECGIGMQGMKDFLEGDLIVTYTTQELKRTLE
ncbi:MAG: translation initiation factor IF-2 [Candidatus Marinimicrobia bacterium]|nr:translation initiation factor IF-2 [Candidatus Neomarinimicrobiota bacterium]